MEVVRDKGRVQMIFFIVIMFIVITVVYLSLKLLFIPNTIKGKRVSVENFVFLMLLYMTVLLGFALLYLLLEGLGYSVLHETIPHATPTYWERLQTHVYFSAVTLFSVGYGDIAPIGVGRLVAVVEALVGYTIPAAFVARAVFDREKTS